MRIRWGKAVAILAISVTGAVAINLLLGTTFPTTTVIGFLFGVFVSTMAGSVVEWR